MQKFTNLRVWQSAHALMLAIYDVAKLFPQHELFVLGAQLRKAALSVSSNIAEGSKRAQPADYAHFLNIAQASLSEIECQVMAARDLGYIAGDRAEELINEAEAIGRQLHFLRDSVLRNARTTTGKNAADR